MTFVGAPLFAEMVCGSELDLPRGGGFEAGISATSWSKQVNDPARTPTKLPVYLGRRAHIVVLAILQILLATELVLLIERGRWMHVFLVIGVMMAILSPELLKRRLRVEIPSEIQITAILFVFASFFLGEVRDYYERIWWWDQALHASAGLLLGLLAS